MIARPPRNDLRLASPDETRPIPKKQRANPMLPVLIVLAVIFLCNSLPRLIKSTVRSLYLPKNPPED